MYDTELIEEKYKQYKEKKTQDAKEELIIACAPLVKLLASKKYVQNANPILDKEDYESYAIIGLLDAIEKFDSSMNVKFITYASIRINGTIIDNLRTLSPYGRTDLIKKKEYQKAVEETVDKYGYNYTREQFLSVINKSEEETKEIERLMSLGTVSSLDSLLADFSNNSDTKFDVKDEKDKTGEDIVLNEELRKAVQDALSVLTERERQVISLVYIEECTKAETARILDVSQSRISQILNKSFKKLRVRMNKYFND